MKYLSTRSILSLLLVPVANSISLAQNATEMQLSDIPCHSTNYQSNQENIRASAYAVSSDFTIARDKALLLAKELLAANVKSNITAVAEIYTLSTNQSQLFRQEFEGMVNETVSESLEGFTNICQQQEKIKGKQVKVYVALELKKNNMFQLVEKKVLSNEKTKVDFDKAAFEKIVEKEMRK